MLFEAPLRITRSAWIEHTPFAMWLVDKMRPRNFVELGTHTGVSFSAVNQAVKRIGLPTRTYAIDTWQGDDHAGSYDEHVYRDLKQHIAQHYSDSAQLLRCTFDEALDHFPDNSIDLLHIDGLHTYEAVLHDYTTWLPKVRAGGIILFHDIAVKDRGFGVHQLWAEVEVPGRSFAFEHGFGLGVLSVDGCTRENLAPLFDVQAPSNEIRSNFAYLGAHVGLRSRLLLSKP